MYQATVLTAPLPWPLCDKYIFILFRKRYFVISIKQPSQLHTQLNLSIQISLSCFATVSQAFLAMQILVADTLKTSFPGQHWA